MPRCRPPPSSSFVLATTRLRALQLAPGPHGSRNHGSYQEEPQSSQPSPATARKPPGQNPTPLDSKGPHGCGFAWRTPVRHGGSASAVESCHELAVDLTSGFEFFGAPPEGLLGVEERLLELGDWSGDRRGVGGADLA